MLRIQSSSHVGRFHMASQFLHFWFSSMRTSYCWILLWAAGVSTDGPGEMGGTGCSAEMRRSSLVCSGTARIPEHCFGNSGENWSARRNRRRELTDERREDHHNGMEKPFIRGSWIRSSLVC